jgi:FG-GAP repeat
MKQIYSLLSILFFTTNAFSQNVGIGTLTPSSNLEIRNPGKAVTKISSNGFNDTTQLIFSNRNTSNAGTDMHISSNREEGLRIFSSSDLTANNKDTIMQITPQGNVGIRTTTPLHPLDVKGNINVTGEIKTNGASGTAGQILTNNGNGSMQWAEAKTNGSVGFGAWGDCSTNNISEYNPVVDTAGAANDLFGNNVSISGNYAIIGALGDDVGANTNQGSASIFQFNGTNWVLMQKIIDPSGAVNDFFGSSVAISGNYAIVGSPSDDVLVSDQGSVSIFQFNGSSWVFMQKITDVTGQNNDNFGNSVSISGNYIIVGAQLDDVGANTNQGSATIFQLSGASWVLMQKITDATGSASDYFGSSVSISGNYAIVGAQLDDIGANIDQGSANIYQLSGASWVLMQKITDATGAASDYFGSSVSISGNYAIVGAEVDDVGANLDQGSAGVFQFNGTSWVLIQKIIEANGIAYGKFGHSVSISGNYVIVGMYFSQTPVTIYQRLGLGWQKVQTITEPGAETYSNFGISVAIDATTKRFLIGASAYGPSSGEAVFGKLNF